MKTTSRLTAIGLGLVLVQAALLATAQSADPGWPRVFKQDKKQLTVYQPQVDYWNGYTNIHFRFALAVVRLQLLGWRALARGTWPVI